MICMARLSFWLKNSRLLFSKLRICAIRRFPMGYNPMGLPSSCVSLSVRAMISDPDRLPASSRHNAVSVGFRSSYSVAACFITVARLNLFSQGAPPAYGPHGSRCTLTFCHSHCCFFQNANTWYGWLTIPYPTGTLTLQETPSFAWRTRYQCGKILRCRSKIEIRPDAS
jgi:hypothetical protein